MLWVDAELFCGVGEVHTSPYSRATFTVTGGAGRRHNPPTGGCDSSRDAMPPQEVTSGKVVRRDTTFQFFF